MLLKKEQKKEELNVKKLNEVIDLSSFILVAAILTGVIFISAYKWTLATPHFVPWWILSLILVFLYMLISGLLSAVIRRHRK